jgi:fluoride exporter
LARRQIWLSGVLAPSGALLRWQLARLNGVHAHLPVGTLAANAVACALDVIVAATEVAADVAIGSVAAVGLGAVVTGVGGTLSTVSTWSSEIFELRKGNRKAWAYLYIGVSIAAGQLLGVGIYGGVVWARR